MTTETKKTTKVLGRGLAALISTPVPVMPEGNLARSTTTQEDPTKTTATFSSPFGPIRLENGPTSSGHTSATPPAKSQPTSPEDAHVRFVPTASLYPNPKQPRQEFSQSEIDELTNSIKTLGVLQPILVRPGAGEFTGKFEIIAGERRWRASTAAKIPQVPVIIKEINDREVLEIALVENIQRSNLSPIEEAQAYARLSEEFNLSQREIAERVGKDRASIANYLRLLSLPPTVIEMLRSGQITMGHAKAILTVREPSAQIGLANKVIAENLSVRALEAIVSRVVVLEGGKKRSESLTETKAVASVRSDFPEVTDKLRAALGTKVVIRHHESGRGRIEIEYFSEQELDRIVELVTAQS